MFLLFSSIANAEYRDSFESAQVSWKLADSDCNARLAAQQRSFDFAHSGNASEFLGIMASRGTFAHLIYSIEPSRVIAEWQARLWVYSKRPGFQLIARAVLPRSVDPRTGKPLSVLLRGDIYDQPGTWQMLSLNGVDVLLERQVRVLRLQFGPDVDPREAFIDLIVLNAYGGVGLTQLWIDDLEVVGHVPATTIPTVSVPAESPADRLPAPAAEELGPIPEVEPSRLSGSVLLADGRPIFTRAIEHRGESFGFLKSLGFNTIKLDTAPTTIQLQQAAREGVWLIAPPPNDGQISAAHDTVLCWYLGSELGEDRLELTRQRVAALRRIDIRKDRPLMCEPSERNTSYSRLANLLLVRFLPLGGDGTLGDFGAKLRDWPLLARGGTPMFATIQTEPTPELLEQWAAIGLGPPATLAVEPDQIRLLVYHALASGARGLIFQSQNPLDQENADTQIRRDVLRRINLELDVVEPWAAGGMRQDDVKTERADIRIGVLQTERAQLVMILRQEAGQQCTLGPTDPRPLSFVMPFAPVAPEVFQLTAGGLKTLQHKRVAGGVRVTLDQPSTVSLVAITQEPLEVDHLARSLAANAEELTRLSYAQAAGELRITEQVHAQLIGPTQPPTALDEWLNQARAYLRHCELLLGASDMAGAQPYAEACLQEVYRVRRNHWLYMTSAFSRRVASPYCIAFGTLPLHAEMSRRLQADSAWSENVLAAGDFEDVGHLQSTGWQNIRRTTSHVAAEVALSAVAPQNGRSALQLQAWAVDPQHVPPALENPPVRIISAPVRVRRGQLVRIHGWINIPRQITASHDGLMIYDSCSKKALAMRVQATRGWEEFVLYRAATYDGNLTVTLDLTGLGEALVDNMTISLHDPIAELPSGPRFDQARRLPPVNSHW